VTNADKTDQPPSGPPPAICVNDRVLVHYAVLTESVGFNAGHGLLSVGAKEIGRVPCLAICKDKESPQVTLYCCDSDWAPIGIAACETVDAAKKKAERIYPGSSPCWVEAEFTDADAKRYLDEQFSDLRCSFCGKGPHETDSAFFEGNGKVRICADCVRQFANS
jgi:ClpX C4-type zinc finger